MKDEYVKNQLLSILSPEHLDRLKDHLELVQLQTGQVLHEPYQPIPYVHFFCGGLSSEIAEDGEGERIEVGCIGKEGLSGVPVVLGVLSGSHKAFMQIGGPALRIASPKLISVMETVPEIRQLLLRYVHAFLTQVAATALADGRYELTQRLARWLLMTHDRIDRTEIPLTHDFLALMLGVRRSGVTTATHLLEGDGLIKAERGLITIRNREGLEKLAGGSYGLSEKEYNRVVASIQYL